MLTYPMSLSTEQFDVIIIGAGISGIGSAYYLQKDCPSKSFLILESRSQIGGTWDFFKYPGIRSDSDMQSMGYAFSPWEGTDAISEGHLIREYVEKTAKKFGIYDNIRFNHRVVKAAWSSSSKLWTIECQSKDAEQKTKVFSCRYLVSCAGYYKYDEGYRPPFKNEEQFEGPIVHPQQWPENIDYAQKKIVVIGSGATAITLVPNLARQAAHVTMLQRSPTYIVSRPKKDGLVKFLSKFLPMRIACKIARWRNIRLVDFYYKMMTKHPDWARKRLENLTKKELGEHYKAENFTPRYNPWEQRLCLVPDSDLFEAIKEGQASIETDEIDCFTQNGVLLKSGKELKADIIVPATGFNLQLFGGIDIFFDEQKVDPANLITYKGILFSGLPNFFSIFGYINASWTLKVDIAAAYITRVLNHLDNIGKKVVTPVWPQENAEGTDPFVDTFSSGYIRRAVDQLPRQGKSEPWRAQQDYFRDIKILTKDPIEDPSLKFE